MSFMVRRGNGWTGPIRSKTQAEREAEAWRSVGRDAEVVEYTPEVKKEVRAWDRNKRQGR